MNQSMPKSMRIALLALLCLPAATFAQEHAAQGPQAAAAAGDNSQSGAQATPGTSGTTSASGAANAQAPAGQQESLAEAARKAREKKKDAAKPPKVITNDDIPTSGGISAVGTAMPAGDGVTDSAAATTGGTASGAGKDEKAWREKFAGLRHKLEQDQQELEVMQRELGVLNVQYYNDPVKAMKQQLTRSDINDKTAQIEKKKMEIDAEQQAISDAEDDLRKAGGEPGWAR